MKKTLYITDLDGTFLTPEKKVSPRSVEIINRLLAEGMLFSVATARSAATAAELLAPLHLTAPGVLLNGALLYDFSKREYIDCAPISHAAAEEVLKALAEFNRPPFLYTLGQNEICVEFVSLANDSERAFFESRKGKAYKRFEQVEALQIRPQDQVIYFTLQDGREVLQPIYETVRTIPGLSAAFYKDNYSDVYYLELFSEQASKSNGVRKVKRLCGAEKIVAFGDNYNDLDMLRMADIGFVVEDAVDEVKEAADGVIASSSQDGVARYLAENWRTL